jgi:two-component system, NtrC family, sensor kinase
MSVQKKVIGLILLVLLLYGVVDYGVQHMFILPSFSSLEQEEARKNMDRVVQAIDREIALLSTKANDWGSWDESYRFMADHNNTFRNSNMQQASLENLKINAIFIFDMKGKPLWGLVCDLASGKKLDLPELTKHVEASSLTKGSYQGHGIVITSHGPILIAGSPIIKSNGEGPPRGAMVFGQFLDAGVIALQTKTHLTISGMAGGKMSTDQAAIAAELGRDGVLSTVVRTHGEVDHVYRVLPDLFGKPALLLQIDVPKTTSARGKEAVQYALFSLFIAGLLVTIAMVWGLRRIILAPLSKLTRHTVSISQSDDLSQRIYFERKDELGKLAEEFNKMVARLAEAREMLAQQSYSSGIAEMASGVLHNIGNAITPLGVKLSIIRSELQQAPAAEMEMAVAELAEPATPAERRTDLSQFLELAGIELASLVKQTVGNLEQISSQVDHVQMILADQHNFSRNQRLTSPLELSSLVTKTVNLLSEELRKNISLELDGSLNKVGKVQASQIALQQVLSNLLINAAESIHSTGNRMAGRISIRASEELMDNIPMVHLCIEDNGQGIPGEKITKIFERGFSTKSRGSGLGLHWSANTVSSLKGMVYAESEGEGRGAVFHLLLPLAQ